MSGEEAKDATDETKRDEGPPPASDAAAPPGDEADGDRDAIFEALWQRTVEAWDDDKPHAAILDHALKNERLPDLAGRYRAIRDAQPDRAERAQKKIDGIVIAATQMLMATKSPPRTKTPWQWNVTAAIVFALVCAWLFYTLFIPHR